MLNTKNIKFKGLSMSFIGVISNRKFYDNINKQILEKNKENDITIIYLNIRNLENFKNIKFQVIIMDSNMEIEISKLENINILQKICDKAKFILINLDKNQKSIIKKIALNNIITYGLNQKADITISSITENTILIYWQKNIKINNKDLGEIEEIKIWLDSNSKLNIYETLIIYNIFRIAKGKKMCLI